VPLREFLVIPLRIQILSASNLPEVESSGDRARASRLWSGLAQIPGDGDVAARRQVERLDSRLKQATGTTDRRSGSD
jgi:hypothetical protein